MLWVNQNLLLTSGKLRGEFDKESREFSQTGLPGYWITGLLDYRVYIQDVDRLLTDCCWHSYGTATNTRLLQQTHTCTNVWQRCSYLIAPFPIYVNFCSVYVLAKFIVKLKFSLLNSYLTIPIEVLQSF